MRLCLTSCEPGVCHNRALAWLLFVQLQTYSRRMNSSGTLHMRFEVQGREGHFSEMCAEIGAASCVRSWKIATWHFDLLVDKPLSSTTSEIYKLQEISNRTVDQQNSRLRLDSILQRKSLPQNGSFGIISSVRGLVDLLYKKVVD